MTAGLAEDLGGLARDLARAVRALRLARHALTTDPTALATDALDPWVAGGALAPHRHLAGKRTYEALVARHTSRADEALRASCARWVAELTLARLTWDLERNEARALRAPRPEEPRRKRDEAPDEGSASEALLGLLSSETAEIAGSHVDLAARRGARVRAHRDERRTRRDEVAHRLGRPGRFGRALVHLDTTLLPASGEAGRASSEPSASSGSRLVVTASADLIAVLAGELSPASVTKVAPDDAAPGVSEEALVGSAVRFLRTTEPLAKDLLTRAQVARTGTSRAAHGLAPVDTWRLASAREARGAEWPARLTGEWVQRGFVGFGAAPAMKLPAPVGAASFVRAAALYGEALHRQEALRYAAFPLAEDPHFVDAHRTGALFALTVASAPFLARELAAGRGGAVDASKALHASLLFSLRLRALAWLVAHEGVTERVRELDAVTGGPYASIDFLAPTPHDDEPARWLAALTTLSAHQRLVDTLDDDWYRNPRAPRAFATRFSRPALATTFLADAPPDLEAEAIRVGKAFERELG